jgi:hypothetical protein
MPCQTWLGALFLEERVAVQLTAGSFRGHARMSFHRRSESAADDLSWTEPFSESPQTIFKRV